MADVVRIHPHRPEPSPKPDPEPLWREALGRRLRTIRQDRNARLVDVAERAGMSTQYLSEIERGIKEPSSEMIAAVAGALDVDLTRLVGGIAGDLARTAAPARGLQGPVLMAA